MNHAIASQFVNSKKCPVCKKEFWTLWPEQWAYKRGRKYICSWSCLRKYDNSHEGEERKRDRVTKVTLADKQRAVQIAIDGGNPLDFLKKRCKNPDQMWYAIKKKLQASDPELYAKIPSRVPNRNLKAEKPTPYGEYSDEDVKEDHTVMEEIESMKNELNAQAQTAEELPEEKKITKPLQYDGFTVRCIENNYGRFYYDNDHNHIDWTTGEGEEVSFTPQGWKTFCTEVMPKVMAILGVEL